MTHSPVFCAASSRCMSKANNVNIKQRRRMNILLQVRKQHWLYLRALVQIVIALSLINTGVMSWAGTETKNIARQLQNIQISTEADEIITVLELDGIVPQFSVVTLTAPERIVVDLQNIKNARGDYTDFEQLLTTQIRKNGLERLIVTQIGASVRVTFYAGKKLRYTIERDKSALLLRVAAKETSSTNIEPAPVSSETNTVPAALPTLSVGESTTPAQAWKQPNIADKTWSAQAPINESASARAGRKSFAEGLKYEKKQQWDLAFQNFTVARTAEPDNPEYRLHLQRAAQNAALLLTQQGDALAQQNNFAGALQAYKSAYSYDATNEQARIKLQQTRARLETDQANGNNAIGAASNKNTAANKITSEQTVYFNNANLRQVIEMLAHNLGLNVLFDESFRDEPKFRLNLENISLPKALDQILLQTKHTFERTERRTILIYQDNPQNRQRFEQLMFKTFYLSNADLTEARTLVQSVIGQNRQVLPVKNLNALVVRDTPANLQIVQDLLDSIDKNRAEVLVDVDIYEVSRSTSTAIGNQISINGISTTSTTGTGTAATTTTKNSAGLNNLGGIGLAGISAIAGQTVTGGLGTIIGLPPSTLSLLKSKSNSKLLASTQIHALDGEQNQTKVGRSVPVRIGSTFVPGFSGTTSGATTVAGGTATSGLGSFDSIQYRDVGLIIDVTPTVNNEGWVQIKMKLESSSVETAASGANLTPSFSQRALTTLARVMDGRTAVVAGVKQETKGDSRAGIPVIGMVPILGRLFSTPQEESSLSDIIITVTPHIMRATNIRPQDYRTRLGGSFLTGVNASVDDLMRRVQEEEEQNRSLTRPASSVLATATPGANSVSGKEPEAPINRVPTNFPPTEDNAVNAAPVVNFSLTPNVVSQAPNESFYVAVSVSGNIQINEALVALSYNPAILQLKSIQQGTLLGKQSTITPQGENGLLRFLIQQEANLPPVQAEGQLLILEFAGLKAGKTTISFINGEQGIKLGQPVPAQFQLQSAEVEVK